MDAYQPIYDAVRSRISNGDIGSAVESALRDASLGHYVERATAAIAEDACRAAEAYAAPSAVYRPALKMDGSQWCALYGKNLQEGVAGFGDTPAAAMRDFDKAWATCKAGPVA
jgi:hypothetical protein